MTTTELQHVHRRDVAKLSAGIAIEVRALTKTYPGGVEAVKAIDFSVARGEVFGLLGPNGAGKSTTIGMLTTTLAPTSGTALLAGFDVAEAPGAARQISSVVFQDPVVDRSFTGRRNLDLHARLWGVPADRAASRIGEIAAALDIVDILDRAVSGYSGGQRRRLEIGRALVSDPTVLFLDEPTVGLDPRIRHELLDVLQARGVAGDDAFAVGSTVTVPLRGHSAADAITAVHEIGVPATTVTTRPPTLDDVYLRLTGDRLGGD